MSALDKFEIYEKEAFNQVTEIKDRLDELHSRMAKYPDACNWAKVGDIMRLNCDLDNILRYMRQITPNQRGIKEWLN